MQEDAKAWKLGRKKTSKKPTNKAKSETTVTKKKRPRRKSKVANTKKEIRQKENVQSETRKQKRDGKQDNRTVGDKKKQVQKIKVSKSKKPFILSNQERRKGFVKISEESVEPKKVVKKTTKVKKQRILYTPVSEDI